MCVNERLAQSTTTAGWISKKSAKTKKFSRVVRRDFVIQDIQLAQSEIFSVPHCRFQNGLMKDNVEDI